MKNLKLAVVSAVAALSLMATPAFAQDFHRPIEQDFHFRNGRDLHITTQPVDTAIILLPAVQSARESAKR